MWWLHHVLGIKDLLACLCVHKEASSLARATMVVHDAVMVFWIIVGIKVLLVTVSHFHENCLCNLPRV